MKKFKQIILFLVIAVIAFTLFFKVKDPNIKAKSAVLMNADTGEILYQKNKDAPFAAASMSKMMTQYLVLEQIEAGLLDWEEQVVINNRSVDSDGVKIDVELGDTLTVRDLFIATAVASANNAAVALAEHVAGSEEDFSKLMNEKAIEMDLSDVTHFVNATGLENEQLDDAESQMSALDVATLSYHLLKDFPKVLEVTSLSQYQLDYDDIVLYSTNEMLETYSPYYFEGVDGLKTGFTDEAGYCFAGTAQQGNTRLISVVMGTEDDEQRFIETKNLLSVGFNKFQLPSLRAIVKDLFQ